MSVHPDGRCVVHQFNDHQEPADFHSTASTGLTDLLNRVGRQQNIADESIYTGYLGLVLATRLMRQIGFDVEQMPLQEYQPSRRCTFLTGSAGYFALQTVLTEGRTGLQDLLELGQQVQAMPLEDCELLYGRTGYLYALLFVRRQLGSEHFAHDIVSALVEQIVQEGRRQRGEILQWAWHGKAYFGAVHGMAGILYVLLHCQLSEIGPHLQAIQKTADWLIANGRMDNGNFRSSLHSQSDLIHFCHGAPGTIPLLVKLAHFFPHAGQYLRIAQEAGEVVWQRGLLATKGPGLCHGIPGNACALLDMYRLTADKKWLHRAQHFCLFAVQHMDGLLPHADHPYSLFEGATGALYALAATLHADRLPTGGSCFPGLGYI